MEKAQGRKGGRGGAAGAGSPSHNAMPPERARGPQLHALCCRKKQHISFQKSAEQQVRESCKLSQAVEVSTRAGKTHVK